MTDQLPPHVARIYDEWVERNPEPADGNGRRGILVALLMVAVIAALITFVMWTFR